MSTEISNLAFALGILAIGFISIGPNILAIIGTSMERGRKDGMRLALGVGIGSGLWATITVGGVTAIVTAYAGIVSVLKLVGAAYLLWLAFKAFRSAATSVEDARPMAVSARNLMFQGMIIQMTNPKAALQWIAIVSLGLGADAPLWTGLVLIGCATFISIAGHIAYAVLFSTQHVIFFYRKFRRWVDGGMGLFFSFAAFKVASGSLDK